MAKKKVGKDQVDLEPIGIAIDECVAGLKKLKDAGKLTRKQTSDVKVKMFKLGLLRKLAEFECCDQQWFCPCPDPHHLDQAAAGMRRGGARRSGGRRKK